MGLFSRKSREAAFWAWFAKNEDMLFRLEEDQERVFRHLTDALQKVSEDLTFEFSTVKDGKREFIISADGYLEAFPVVEALHAAAPDLPRWEFFAFRQRKPVAFTIEMGDIKLTPEDVEVAIEADGEKAGFTVFVKGMTEELRDPMSHAVFIMLDTAIGEYDMETKVGFIELKDFGEPSEYARQPLPRLPEVFDGFLSR